MQVRTSQRTPSFRNAKVDDHVDAAWCSALTRRWTLSVPWRVLLQKQLQAREGKDKVLTTWIPDVITLDLGRRGPFVDARAPACAHA